MRHVREIRDRGGGEEKGGGTTEAVRTGQHTHKLQKKSDVDK